ncbi:tetratricopeptide repeat protein [uncultured Algibacter sp.]|uniref:tetratricopeptide repeat protein n=1 Tax=uncultured Algibacter sp. TaxID=298659 RepID=UPI003216217D
MSSKNFLLFILHAFSYSFISAQNGQDSIPNSYKQVFIHAQDSVVKYTELSKKVYRTGNLEAYKTYSNILLTIAKTNHLRDAEIRALANLAIYHQQTAQYDVALTMYLEAKKLTDSLDNTSYSKIMVEANLGNFYNATGKYTLAKTTMKELVELINIHHKGKDYKDQFLATCYSAMGTAALYEKNLDEALGYMTHVKDLALKFKSNDMIIKSYINISDCHRHLKQYDKAISNATKALDRITKTESTESEALAKFIIGASYIDLNQPNKALPLLKDVKDIAKQGHYLKIKMEVHQHLVKVYESLNLVEDAFEEQKAYSLAREAYLNTLSKAQRIELEKESKTKSSIINKQQKSIAFLSREKQFYIFFGIILTLLLIISSMVYWKKRKRLADESIQLEGDKILLQNENEALKDKLNALAVRVKQKEQLVNHDVQIKSQKTSLSQAEQHMYMNKILEYMEEEKPYLDHEIKQSDIASKLDMSVHLFSEVLNACFEKNFNMFINLYRVDKAKQLIKKPEYAHYKILAIGYEAGFPSKTSFNRVFKGLVGLTPSEYKNSLEL